MNKGSLILVLMLPASMYPQIFSWGVKGGIPATNAFQGSSAGTYERRYVIGPTAELHLPFHLAFEVDALYRRSGLSGTFITYQFGGPPAPAFVGFDKTTINDWQVPFLAKWEHGGRVIRPFIDGGVTYRHLSGENTTQFFITYGTPGLTQSSPVTSGPDMAGATVGGGIAAKLAILRISPEIRYTHWASPPYAGTYVFRQISADQVDFLVGVTF